MIKVLVAGPEDPALEHHHLKELTKKVEIEVFIARTTRQAQSILRKHPDMSAVIITTAEEGRWSAKNFISRIQQHTGYKGFVFAFTMTSVERKKLADVGYKSYRKSDFPKHFPLLLGLS